MILIKNYITYIKNIRAYFLIGFFCCIGLTMIAQNQKVSDSLENIYKSGDYDKAGELEILKLLAESETDAEKIISYSLQLIVAAKSIDSSRYEFLGYIQKGNGHKLKSDVSKALESYFIAAKIASEAPSLKKDEASVNITIADVYSIMGDTDMSFKYYRDALKLMEKSSVDPLTLADAQFNFGDEFLNIKELDSALLYLVKAGEIYEAQNDENGKAYYLGNLGLVYAEKGENDKAELNLNEAIDLLESLGDYYGISIYLNAMSEVYTARGEHNKSYEYVNRSLQLAKKHGLKDQVSDAYLKLSAIYENNGNIKRSFDNYKNHIVYRDSVKDLDQIQKAASTETDFKVSQKQLEIDLSQQQKKTQKIIIAAIGLILLFIIYLAVSLFKRNKFMKNANEVIANEKQRSDDLLTNILPEETAQELKEHGEVKAKQFDSVSVLFTDFKGFTEEAGKLSPEKLVESINFYFSKFDEIIKKHDLEKIKTIGDAYMLSLIHI